jgi:alkylation response protein AidB-like acyl-CoA dehydrogenase
MADMRDARSAHSPYGSAQVALFVRRGLAEAKMTPKSFSGKIQDLLPAIRAHREETEKGRRLPRGIVDQLVDTGVFGLAVPRALGGDEVDPPDQLRAIETVSVADGSTGWCAMIALGNGAFAGYMPEVGAKEVFAEPSLPTAAAIAPSGAAIPVDGGFRASGRWRFASGIEHTQWVLGGCVVTENGVTRTTPAGTPQIVHLFMPIKDVRIHDTWHVSGLCGTGSQDFEAADVFVPQERVVAIFDAASHRPEPLYQMPVLPLFAAHVAAVGLGIARAALDELTELSIEKTPSFSTTRMAEKPVTQVELARAEAALGAARSFLYDTLDDLWQTVVAGLEPTRRQHALCRIAALHASESAALVTRVASVLAGGTSIYNSSALQRHARDADAVTHHVTQSPQMWEESGRVLLDLEPLFPIF